MNDSSSDDSGLWEVILVGKAAAAIMWFRYDAFRNRGRSVTQP